MRKRKFLCVAAFLISGIAASGVHFVSSANNLEEQIVEIDVPQCLPNLTVVNPKISEDGNMGIDTSYADTSGFVLDMLLMENIMHG